MDIEVNYKNKKRYKTAKYPLHQGKFWTWLIWLLSKIAISGKDYKVESCRIQKSCNLLKLQGIDTMEAAQAMHGKTLEIYREDADPDIIFAAELIGMDVYQDDCLIGKLADVLDYPGNKVYVVKGEQEYMIPAVKAFVLDTDMENNRMQVKLIEGMATNEN